MAINYGVIDLHTMLRVGLPRVSVWAGHPSPSIPASHQTTGHSFLTFGHTICSPSRLKGAIHEERRIRCVMPKMVINRIRKRGRTVAHWLRSDGKTFCGYDVKHNIGWEPYQGSRYPICSKCARLAQRRLSSGHILKN